jgi:hypothetical protein
VTHLINRTRVRLQSLRLHACHVQSLRTLLPLRLAVRLVSWKSTDSARTQRHEMSRWLCNYCAELLSERESTAKRHVRPEAVVHLLDTLIRSLPPYLASSTLRDRIIGFASPIYLGFTVAAASLG